MPTDETFETTRKLNISPLSRLSQIFFVIIVGNEDAPMNFVGFFDINYITQSRI